jgi:hypothetical protein
MGTQDALQEFKVMTDNLPVDYDRFAGGIMSFTTKTGTDRLHGAAYEFMRNKVLNSNNFFSNANGVPVGPFTQNQFGGNVGGRIIKDKLFFFASFDGFRLREGLPLVFTVPTQAERAGDFSKTLDTNGNLIPIYDPLTTCGASGNPACATPGVYTRTQFSYNGVPNVLPPNRIDSTAKFQTALWGMPNSAGQQYTGVNNWAGSASEGGDMNEFTVRLDQNVSDKQRIFERYTMNKYDNLAIDPWHTDTYPLSIGTPENTTTSQAVFDDSYMFTPKIVGDFELSYLRNGYERIPASLGYNMSQLGPNWAALTGQTYNTIPQPCVTQITDFCSQETGSTIYDATDDWALMPNLTIVKGRHTIKFGGDFRLSRFAYSQDNDPTGLYYFSQGFTSQSPITAVGGYGFATFMLGNPYGGLLLTTNRLEAQQIYTAEYIEDKIRATRKLTVNVGFRYNREDPFTERHNRISTFIGGATNPLAQASGLPLKGQLVLVNSPQNPSRSGYQLDPHMFAPRIGLAYQLTPKTVLRGGYGIFWLPKGSDFFGNIPAWDPINLFYNDVVGSVNGGLTPYTQYSNPWPNGIIPAPERAPNLDSIFEGTGFYFNVPKNPTPYAQQWNIDVQRELPGGIFVDAAYGGSKGTHLMTNFPTDQLNPKYMSLGSALINPVANPFQGLMKPYNPTLNGPTIPAMQLLLPYPQYTSTTVAAMAAFDSEYSSFQLKVQKNFKSGQTILVSYTNSKLMNDGGEALTGWLDQGSAGFQNYYNLKGERSLSSYDVPQRLVISYVLDLPVGTGRKFAGSAHGVVGKLVTGWGVNGIVTVQSGWPLAMGTLYDLTYSGGSRPNYNPGGAGCAKSAQLSGSAESRLNEWFNTTCFSQPAPFTFGNTSRYMGDLRSDSLSNFDFALFKNTNFGPDNKFGIQFRTEFFNLFNTPQFGLPNTTIGYTGAGIVSSQSNNPRLIQFALKFMF